LKEDVYVCQPEGFIDADHPSHVYKIKKDLYGLKQAPRAWYDELSTFLLQNHFFKGTIDLTLFIRRFHDNILVVQVYVDDIIFEILKKYGMESYDLVGTPMEIKDKVDQDQNGTPVDATKYRSMIGALMYLTSSRPDIVHATCLCARYQAKPTEKHLKEVKRIFHYLHGTVNMGLWYLKDSSFELTGFSDADYAGCKDIFKRTSGGAQVILFSIHSDEWKSFKSQHQTALRISRWRYNLIPVESKFKTSCLIIKDKYMMKAQYMLRGRLSASFQDLEHEGGDTRSQGGIRFKNNDIKIKIQDHRHANGSSKGIPKNTRLLVSRRLKKDSLLNDHP
nr:hypothetical protein [Tanacetum cinerariifolium]